MPVRVKWNIGIALFIAIITLFSVYPTFRWESMDKATQDQLDKKWVENDYYYRDKDAFSKISYFFSKWFEGCRDMGIKFGLDLRGGMHLVFQIDTSKLSVQDKRDVTKRVRAVIERRINQFGVAEPAIFPQGVDQIVVQLPGVVDRERAVNLVGKTALLEFRIVNNDPEKLKQAVAGNPVPGFEVVYEDRDSLKIPLLVKKDSELTGANLKNAMMGFGQSFNEPEVELEFDGTGAKIFAAVTREYVGRQLAILLDGSVLTAPVIQTEIPNGRARITGKFSQQEAQDLSTILSAGAMPAPVTLIEDRSVSPSLGKDSINKGILSTLVGLAAVLLFMIWYYRFSGLIANLALCFNFVIILAALTWFGGTLTLPGIAGIALSLGMAVDANVLINERIREELAIGKKIRTAIAAGYDRAFSAIFDSNLTTVIAAAMLFMFGTGPVRGFALTLTIGVCASMYTAVVVTKTIFDVRSHDPEFSHLKMTQWITHRNLNFIKYFGPTALVSLAVIVVGMVFWGMRGDRNYGIDFTGGTLAEIRFEKPVAIDALRASLKKIGVEDTGVQKVATGEEIMIRTKAAANFIEPLQGQFPDNKITMLRREQVGAMVGADLTRKTVLACILAILLIAVYVGLRFEFKFSVGALLSLAHDAFICLAVVALTGREMSLNVVAAILTVLGYSINDTIVIFDRIRENLKMTRKMSFEDIVNMSINQTLSRTLLTTLTVVFVTLALYLLGGEVINDFAFILLIGTISGVYSTIFMASAFVVFWHRRQVRVAAAVRNANPGKK